MEYNINEQNTPEEKRDDLNLPMDDVDISEDMIDDSITTVPIDYPGIPSYAELINSYGSPHTSIRETSAPYETQQLYTPNTTLPYGTQQQIYTPGTTSPYETQQMYTSGAALPYGYPQMPYYPYYYPYWWMHHPMIGHMPSTYQHSHSMYRFEGFVPCCMQCPIAYMGSGYQSYD